MLLDGCVGVYLVLPSLCLVLPWSGRPMATLVWPLRPRSLRPLEPAGRPARGCWSAEPGQRVGSPSPPPLPRPAPPSPPPQHRGGGYPRPHPPPPTPLLSTAAKNRLRTGTKAAQLTRGHVLSCLPAPPGHPELPISSIAPAYPPNRCSQPSIGPCSPSHLQGSPCSYHWLSVCNR